jgi:hypothetical protein
LSATADPLLPRQGPNAPQIKKIMADLLEEFQPQDE